MKTVVEKIYLQGLVSDDDSARKPVPLSLVIEEENGRLDASLQFTLMDPDCDGSGTLAASLRDGAKAMIDLDIEFLQASLAKHFEQQYVPGGCNDRQTEPVQC